MRLRLVTTFIALASVASGALAQAPAVFTNLGTIGFGGSEAAPTTLQNDPGVFSAGQIKWFQFTLTGGGVTSLNDRFLDIYTTQDPTNTLEGNTNTDSEIGVYDSLGNRLNNDDDDGSSLFSQLTYGLTGTPRTIGVGGAYPDAQPTGATAPSAFNGRDLALAPGGSLPDGTYWLATGRFNVTFGATNWTVTSNDTSTINNQFRLKVGSGALASSSAPEPGTLALVGLGALAGLALKRRRN